MHFKTQPIPDKVRCLTIVGVQYFIYWEAMTVGASFFIPTTATVSLITPALKPVEEYFGYVLKAVTRCEHGMYGARIWRLA